MKAIHLFKPILFLILLLAPAMGWTKPVIVVDAAHGGADPGVKAGPEIEKEWNLRLATAIERALEDAGFEVVQVRHKDETLSTEKRAEKINTLQASAVLVIHTECEWSGDHGGPMIVVEPPTQGTESTEIPRWGVITPYQYRISLKLGRDIAQALGLGGELSSLSDSRGLAGEPQSDMARLYCLPHQSLRYLAPPAVVVTPFFLSNRSDIRKFSTDEGLSEFSNRVARGIANFLQ